MNLLPSSPSYKERSKLPEGLKATEAETCRLCCRFKLEQAKGATESEMGLQEIHGVGEETACFNGGQSGNKDWKVVAIDAGLFSLQALSIMVGSEIS